MDDFTKRIKENLEGQSAPVFRESAWDRMQKKLEDSRRRPGVGAFWWWAAGAGLLIIGLLSSNIILATQLSDAKAKTSIPSNQEITPSNIDTVVIAETVYVTDTVYIVNEVVRWRTTPAVAAINLAESTQTDVPAMDPVSAGTGEIVSHVPGVQSAKILTAKDASNAEVNSREELTGENIPSHTHHEIISTLATLEARHLQLSLRELGDAVNRVIILPKERRSLGEIVRPKAFEIGLVTAANMTNFAGTRSQVGYEIGLEASMYFSRRVRLWAATNYLKYRYRSGAIDASIDIPQNTPPGESFEFKFAEVSLPGLKYSAGMSYQMSTSGIVRPYVGVGYARTWSIERAVLYHYEDVANDIDLSVREEILGRELDGGQLVLHLGTDFVIDPNWSLSIQGGYELGLHQRPGQKLRILSLGTRINYIF